MAEYEWTTWNDASTCTSCTIDTWGSWCGTSTTATSIDSSTIWYAWVQCDDSATGNATYRVYRPVQPQETAEELKQRIAQERQREQEREARIAEELKQAVAKAERLLMESLREKQREEYQKFNRFTVLSKDGKRTYRINKGRSRNVQLIDQKGKVLKTYCAHPAECVPDQDTMLAQKLLLEHEEERFLKLANVS